MPTGTFDETEPRGLRELIEALDGARLAGDPNTRISGIQYDSRKVRPGDLFVALVGGYVDGHDFIDRAIDRDAVAVMAERPLALSIPHVVVSNTRAALAPLAAEFFGHPSKQLPVIGITGTDGKTTTSHLVESILSHAGLRTGMIGTIGVRLGSRALDAESRQTTPESLDVQRHLRSMVEGGADAAIVEATSHGLDLHRLDATEFRIGAVTSITHEHLEHHKTVDAYRRAKAKLFEAVTLSGGRSVINLDDPGARGMLGFVDPGAVMTYSLNGADADLIASNIELTVDGTSFELTVQGQAHTIKTPLVGRFNVENSVCALGIALSHDISLKNSIESLAQSAPIPGRMQAIRHGQPFSVVVDYAHTPDSIEKVLSLLKRLNPEGRLIVVIGSAGERDRGKRPLQGEVAVRLADFSVFTTEDPRYEDPDSIIDEIASGARRIGAIEGTDFVRVTDRRTAIERAIAVAQPGDCVLLAGKGHEQSIIWGQEKRPWDEASVAAETLDSLGFRRSET